MKIGKTFYTAHRSDWRHWLINNHDKETDIWLIYYKKASGKPRISYNDAVEEALCFGWIDSIVKSVDKESFAQRFSPRRKNSNWSAPNLERMKKLIKLKLMTEAGLINYPGEQKFKIPEDIKKELKADKKVWANFQKFPDSYQNVRIAFIDDARTRPEEFRKRLNYFLKMTRENKKFGMKI